MNPFLQGQNEKAPAATEAQVKPTKRDDSTQLPSHEQVQATHSPRRISPDERAFRWLEATPGAISGSGGHNATFAVATALVHGFCLEENTAHSLMVEHWNGKCQPPWTSREIAHKVSQAASVGHAKPRGWMLTESGSQSPTTESKKFVYHKNPVAIPEPKGLATRDFLLQAFLPEEKVCICTDVDVDELGKARPVGRGTFQTLEWWLKEYFPEGGEMPSLFRQKGTYLRINPCADDTGSDNGVSSYRHVLVESDSLPKEEQKAALLASKLPFTALIDSGGSSIHGWVRVDAADRKEWEQRRDEVYKALEHVGIDAKNKNASRFSRLPGAFRNGMEQKLVALRVGPQTWDEYVAKHQSRDETKSLPTARCLFDLSRSPKDNPADLFQNGFLRKEGCLLLVGPTGVGKSSLVMQWMIQFARGREAFGMQPTRRIKSLLIQAENDDDDLVEMRDGVVAGLGLSGADIEAIRGNVLCFNESGLTGKALVERISALLEEHRPDILYLDPALAFLGGDASKQEVVGAFLRYDLAPLLKRFQCALILSHHTNKPPREPVAGNSANQAYAGAGSAEWANFSRAILTLLHTDKEGTFKLCAVKRGKRLGWKLPDGKTPTTERFLKHSSQEGQIYWEEAAEKFVVDRGNGKRPKPPADIMALVPPDKLIAKSSLIENARQGGIGEKRARNLIDAALANEDLFLHRKPREGTNPEPWISRLRETPEGFLPPSKAIESKTLATDAGTSETPPPECQSPN